MAAARQSNVPLSIADTLDALDEENRETLAALDAQRHTSPTVRRLNSGQAIPSRLTLDADMPTPRHGSIAGIGVGVTSPRLQERTKPSRLDPSDPSTWTKSHSSKPNSPVLTRATPTVTRPDDDQEDEVQGYVGVPRTDTTHRAMSDSGPSRPRGESGGGSMAAALSGELDKLQVGAPPSPQKNLQKAAAHSRSPSGRVVVNPVGEKGTLSPTSSVDPSHHASASFSTIDSSDVGYVRKDSHGEEHVVDDSSDEQHHHSDSEDEARGRDRDRTSSRPSTEMTSPPSGDDHPASPEPAISITTPDGEERKAQPVKAPASAAMADIRRGSVSSIGSLGDGDEDDIAKAKTLGLSISPLDTKVAHRHVRMIIRGDWLRFHKESEAGERSTRTYLACSDLSVEATYALEWTIGTILRDGDTLLCVYAIEDETAGEGTNDHKISDIEKEQLNQEGHQAGKDALSAMEGLTRQTTKGENQPMTKFIPATEAKSLTGSVDARKTGKAEMERLKAIDEITQTFLRLVRKTSLQVRCMVEVVHCKSPKHLILGAVSPDASIDCTHADHL